MRTRRLAVQRSRRGGYKYRKTRGIGRTLCNRVRHKPETNLTLKDRFLKKVFCMNQTEADDYYNEITQRKPKSYRIDVPKPDMAPTRKYNFTNDTRFLMS